MLFSDWPGLLLFQELINFLQWQKINFVSNERTFIISARDFDLQ